MGKGKCGEEEAQGTELKWHFLQEGEKDGWRWAFCVPNCKGGGTKKTAFWLLTVWIISVGRQSDLKSFKKYITVFFLWKEMCQQKKKKIGPFLFIPLSLSVSETKSSVHALQNPICLIHESPSLLPLLHPEIEIYPSFLLQEEEMRKRADISGDGRWWWRGGGRASCPILY